jgi:hypothetical protein
MIWKVMFDFITLPDNEFNGFLDDCGTRLWHSADPTTGVRAVKKKEVGKRFTLAFMTKYIPLLERTRANVKITRRVLNDLLCQPLCYIKLSDKTSQTVCIKWLCKQTCPPYAILLPYYFLYSAEVETLPYATSSDGTIAAIGPAALLNLNKTDRMLSQANGVYAGPHHELKAFSVLQ